MFFQPQGIDDGHNGPGREGFDEGLRQKLIEMELNFETLADDLQLNLQRRWNFHILGIKDGEMENAADQKQAAQDPPYPPQPNTPDLAHALMIALRGPESVEFPVLPVLRSRNIGMGHQPFFGQLKHRDSVREIGLGIDPFFSGHRLG